MLQKDDEKRKKINFPNREEFEKHGIQLFNGFGGYKNELITICPVCYGSLETDEKRTLYLDHQHGTWHCDYCGWSGKIIIGSKYIINISAGVQEASVNENNDYGFWFAVTGPKDEYSPYLYLNKDIIQRFGTNAAVVLAEIVERYEHLLHTDKVGQDDYFPYPIKILERETGLGHSAQKASVDRLIKSGILKVKNSGKFDTMHFKILSKSPIYGEEYLGVRKLFIEAVDLKFAVLYSALLSTYKSMKDGNQLNDDDYFPFTHEKLEKLCGLNKKEQDNYLNELCSVGLIAKNKNETAAKFEFNHEFLKKLWGYRLINGHVKRIPQKWQWS